MSVCDILSWLSNEMTLKVIIRDYPELTENQINACLSFAIESFARKDFHDR
ncbi:MAG: DUF433 domain-containing protein [Bacteroidales bacterium]|nr:DUF433 domain-containing protein [Bacteroidales bacterium]